MSKSVLIELESILDELQAQTPEIVASIVVRYDGLAIASNVPESIDKALLSALTAAAIGIGRRVMDQLDQGSMKKILIEGDKGQLLLYGMKRAVLALLLRKNANLGLIFLLIEKTVEKLSKLI